MKRNLILLCVAIFTLSLMASAQSDLKIKKTSRMNMPGMPTGMKNPQTGEAMDYGKMPDTSVFIKGQRMLTEMRQEQRGPTGTHKMIMSTLRQCDLGRDVSYNNKSKKYFATSFSSGPSAPKQAVKGKPVTEKVSTSDSGGTVTFTMAYTDTGERQQMFGLTARHVKTVMTSTPSANACNKKAMKVETDAWYIDLPTFSCPTFSPPASPDSMGGDSGGGCRDKMIFKTVGNPDNGFAVKETMTMTMDGQSFSIVSEVTDISRTELDAQLFEIPPGYTEDKESVKNTQNNTAQNNTYTPQTPSNNTTTYTPQGPVPEIEPPLATGDSLAPKRQGMIRIGIAKPNVKTPDSKDDTTAPMQLSAAIRDSLVDALKGENVEAIRLQTDAPEAEALEKECDYIFYANVTQKRGGGGMFGKMIMMGAISMAGAMVPGVGGMIAGTAANVIMGQQMGKMAKAKDEFTLDYKVLSRDKAVLSQAVSKAKTKEDGEDVLTPQLKQASTVVLGEINKKRVQ